MGESRAKYYRALFLFAAIYDMILGIVFTFFANCVFDMLGISAILPSFLGYVTLIGVFLIVIGVAYFLIYRGDMIKNRDLILVGTLYKFAYCATSFYYFAIGQMPHLVFFSLFGAMDFIMLILMAECYKFLGKISRDAKMVSRETS